MIGVPLRLFGIIAAQEGLSALPPDRRLTMRSKSIVVALLAVLTSAYAASAQPVRTPLGAPVAADRALSDGRFLVYGINGDLGPIATSEEMCRLLQHPFLNHSDSEYTRSNFQAPWDPNNLAKLWISNKLGNQRLPNRQLIPAQNTQQTTNNRLAECLSSIEKADAHRLSIIERFF